MKKIYDKLSYQVSKVTTVTYSTSFSMGIFFLKPKIRPAIYAVYGFVRIADEIVDSFGEFDRKTLLDEFERDTYLALDRKISSNPILNSFQEVVHQYKIDRELIDGFLYSMRMDLGKVAYTDALYQKYIYGSAEVVGLMCLKIFTEGNEKNYATLKPYAQKLGSAFQKINFLRDFKQDSQDLGRIYFPNLALTELNESTKKQIEYDIASEFAEALVGIRLLPKTSRFGVYLAYVYYISLFEKIKTSPYTTILNNRVRVPNFEKILLLIKSAMKYKLVGI